MYIPGVLLAAITFPGVIVHELGHKLACHLCGVRIREVCYFRFGNPAGFVVHDPPPSVWGHLLISIAPVFGNTLLGLAIGLAAVSTASPPGEQNWLSLILGWIAVSIAMHAFPSTGDAKAVWRALWSGPAPVLARVGGTPLVGLIFVGALGSIFWLDVIYGIMVGWWLPGSLLGGSAR